MGANAQRRLPGVPGIWIFVLLDMAFFGVLILAFLVERSRQAVQFEQSQAALNLNLGLVNMLVLLTSSWLVALAVHAARVQRGLACAWLLRGGFLCALVFAVLKLVEYGQKIGAGITPLSDGFYMLYFVMTFLHFLHVCAGMVVLWILARHAAAGAYDTGVHTGLESGATYWHMVDLLWIMLFPLLYMAR
jgi:nitric oxide reductase NorE protein